MTFKALRERAKLTQAQLAEAAALDQTAVSRIELGKVKSPQYATVAALAGALNVSAECVAESITESVSQSEAVA